MAKQEILMIDNYDSFTYNLVHIMKARGAQVNVRRNDQISPKDIEHCDKVVISPGPGIPSEAGQVPQLLPQLIKEKPLLGVCLGHQAIAECLGAQVYNMEEVYHGVASDMKITHESPVFKGMARGQKIGRYHSWAVKDLPDALLPTAYSSDGVLMAFEHTLLPVFGLQFHPESVLTPNGAQMIHNFIEL